MVAARHPPSVPSSLRTSLGAECAFLGLIGLLLSLGCSAQTLSDSEPSPNLPTALGSSVAPAGRVRLFVGQDLTTIDDYAAAVAPPSGVVSYTSLAGLEGLSSSSDTGGGPMYLDRLAATYPDAPIALGLYLVNELDSINSGALDAQITTLGVTLARYPVPVLLRAGYEFDAPWSHYDPDAYKRAFVRIRSGIRAAGATRVELVWQSAASCGPTYDGAPVDSWYPGDDAVDLVACSYFAQSACQFSPVKTMLHLAREHQKPFLIAESAPQGYDLALGTFSSNGLDPVSKPSTQIVSEWYTPYFDLIAANSDVIRAVSYIDADWNTQGMWGPPYANGYFGDSRVQANPELLSVWRGALAQAPWLASN